MVAFGSTEEEQEKEDGNRSRPQGARSSDCCPTRGLLGSSCHCGSGSGQTDELIAAVVYRLCRLTEEDIAIVEGKETAESHLLQQ
jgi:hypothetical protein